MPKPTAERQRTEITPSPALERRTRRNFTTEYKLRILAEADACEHGGIGAMLRREHLYSNQLQQWRREFAAEGVAGLSKTVPGPSPARSAEQRRIAELEKLNARLSRKLQIAEDCLDLQKKALSMLDLSRSGNDV